ncbi:MAG: DUF5691 domain-containing protein, partial [Janthinobacterium lividum]
RMTTVTSEVDLVNAALLGTDRRDVPAPAGADPADWLLQLAGRRRAVTLVAGASTLVRPGEPGPVDPRPEPPAAAREILDELVLQASTSALDLWLRAALAAGCGLAPEHWTPVLERARRSTELDRRRLGAALGPRGLWFARHNPAWSAVVRAAEAPTPALPAGDPDAEDLGRLAEDPDRLLTWPDPWSAGVARVALGVLAAGIVGARGARTFGQRVGARVPLGSYAALTQIAPSRLDPAADASARAGLAAAEEVVRARWALAQAFDPARVPPEHQPVPSVPTLQERT